MSGSPAWGIGLVGTLAEELVLAADASAVEGSELLARVVSHINDHLGNPELTVASDARAHVMSVRSLQKLFALTGRTVSETTRHRRLEAIRQELEHPRPASSEPHGRNACETAPLVWTL